MECLFKTHSDYTLDEYKRFNTTIIFKQLSIFSIILEAILLCEAILFQEIYPLIFAVLYFLILYIATLYSAKRIYKSHKIAQNCAVEFEFYGEHFIENTEISTAKIEYKMLHKIIETKTNFYLMTAKNQGYILIKENFPEGLEDFLRNKKDELK